MSERYVLAYPRCTKTRHDQTQRALWRLRLEQLELIAQVAVLLVHHGVEGLELFELRPKSLVLLHQRSEVGAERRDRVRHGERATRPIANRSQQTEQPTVPTRPAYAAPQSAHGSETTGLDGPLSWSACDAAPSSNINVVAETPPRQLFARQVRIGAPRRGPASEPGATADHAGSKSPTWARSQSPMSTGTARTASQATNGVYGRRVVESPTLACGKVPGVLGDLGTSGSPQNKKAIR